MRPAEPIAARDARGDAGPSLLARVPLDTDRFVINLDRRTDRMSHVARECMRAGVTYTRVSAIDAQQLPADTPCGRSPINGRRLKRAEMACAATHQALWKHAASRDVAILVLEDDVQFRDDIGSRLRAPLGLPADFGIFYLGCTHRVPLADAGLPGLEALASCRTTHAYLASPDACAALLALSAERPHLAADHYTSLAHETHRVRAWAATPEWAIQADFTSDIGLRLGGAVFADRTDVRTTAAVVH